MNRLEASALLESYSVFTVDNVMTFVESKQAFKLGRDILAAGEISQLRVTQEKTVLHVEGLVRSSRTKSRLYLVNLTTLKDRVLSVDCACPTRYSGKVQAHSMKAVSCP